MVQPNDILNPNDPGDDTQRRFRFQAGYAAVLSINMLQPDSRIAEVFCELQEDVLLKLTNGKFQGVQVKTRQPHLGLFDIEDEEIIKCVERFVSLDQKFPDCFEGFTIASNGSFSKEKRRSLAHFCQMAKDDKKTELLAARTISKKWINELAKKCKCSTEQIIAVLSRLRLRENFSTLDDIALKLYRELTQLDNVRSQTAGTVNKICESLIGKHSSASSLVYNAPLEGYFISSESPSEELAKSIIEGKRVTKETVERVIGEIISDPIKLFIKDSKGLNAMPTGEKVLELKMDSGGISVENIQLTKDNKFSFESLTAQWAYKMDIGEASKRYDQVKLIVQNECQAAYDECSQESELYGTKMLVNVRKRIRTRFDKRDADFFDCSYEHLLGAVGTLTEECKVWWSKKFSIKEA